MATYFTNFSEFVLNPPYGFVYYAADWSYRYNAAWSYDDKIQNDGDLGGQCLWLDEPYSSYFLSYDGLGTNADVDILAKARTLSWSDRESIRLFARGTQTGAAATAQYYYCELDKYYGRVKIFKVVPGVYPATQIGLGNFWFNINAWVWLRFRIIGNSLKAKVWRGSAEPVAWHIDITDSDIGGAGWAGLGGSNNDSADFDYFSIGTGGDIAPDPIPPCLATVDLLSPTLLVFNLKSKSTYPTSIEPMVWPMNF